VRAAISRDGGATFLEPIEIARGAVSGHVDIVFTGHSSFVISWLEKAGDAYSLRIRSIDAASARGDEFTIATTNTGQQVPQMEYRQDELVLAWTDSDDAGSRIVSARVPLGYRPQTD